MNDEKEIDFSGNSLDMAALTVFVSPTTLIPVWRDMQPRADVYKLTWYDQTGTAVESE